LTALQAQNLIVAQYIDSHLNVTETYQLTRMALY